MTRCLPALLLELVAIQSSTTISSIAAAMATACLVPLSSPRALSALRHPGSSRSGRLSTTGPGFTMAAFLGLR